MADVVNLFKRLYTVLMDANPSEVQRQMIEAGDISVIRELIKRPTKEVLDPAGLGTVKLPDYVENIEYDFLPEAEALQPEQTVDIGALQGLMLVPAYGDRTYAGGALRGIGDVTFDQAVNMQGGNQFMRSQGKGIWASMQDKMQEKADVAKILQDQGEDVRLMYTSMAGQSGDFSMMMSDATMGMIEQSKITKKAAKKFDDWVKKNKTKDSPQDPDWPGILSPNVRDYLKNNMTGSDRRLLWQEMDKTKYQDDGFPNLGVIRASITEPELLTTPYFSTGRSIGTIQGDSQEILTPQKGFIPHETYTGQVEGDYVGRLADDVPGQLIFRDFFESRRAAGTRPSGDQRAFMMTPYTSQKVDQQMIDEVSQYLEAIKQAE